MYSKRFVLSVAGVALVDLFTNAAIGVLLFVSPSDSEEDGLPGKQTLVQLTVDTADAGTAPPSIGVTVRSQRELMEPSDSPLLQRAVQIVCDPPRSGGTHYFIAISAETFERNDRLYVFVYDWKHVAPANFDVQCIVTGPRNGQQTVTLSSDQPCWGLSLQGINDPAYDEMPLPWQPVQK